MHIYLLLPLHFPFIKKSVLCDTLPGTKGWLRVVSVLRSLQLSGDDTTSQPCTVVQTPDTLTCTHSSSTDVNSCENRMSPKA